MKPMRGVLVVFLAIILSCGLAYGQGDTGEPDSLYWMYPNGDTWFINTLDDTTFCASLFAWTDHTSLIGLSLPMWVHVDSATVDVETDRWKFGLDSVFFKFSGQPADTTAVERWSTSIDSLIYIRGFEWDPDSVNAAVTTFNKSFLDPTIGPCQSWTYGDHDEKTYNGCLAAAPYSLSQVIQPNSLIHLGDLCIKMNIDELSADRIVPRTFDIILDTMFFPTGGKLSFSPSGGGYRPIGTFPGKIHVQVAEEIVLSETDTMFLDVGDDDPGRVPTVYALEQNYPNPCNPSTKVKFSLKTGGYAELVVYNILGRSVRTLVNGDLEAGWHEVIWDGRDESGVEVSTGVYFYKLTSGEYVETKKMMLLK